MNPDNVNYIDPTSYRLMIERLPNVQFFCRGVTIPDITVQESETGFRYTNIPMLGDKISFSGLTISIMIDEDMEGYIEVYNWLRECVTNATELSEYMSDVSVVITTSHNNKAKTFRFHNAFPTSIGSLQFSSAETGANYLTADVTMRFTDITIE